MLCVIVKLNRGKFREQTRANLLPHYVRNHVQTARQSFALLPCFVLPLAKLSPEHRQEQIPILKEQPGFRNASKLYVLKLAHASREQASLGATRGTGRTHFISALACRGKRKTNGKIAL